MIQQNIHLNKNYYGILVAVICFLLLIPALRLIPADAQQSPPTGDSTREHELDLKIRNFFDNLKKGNTLAFEELLRDSPFASSLNSPSTPNAGIPASTTDLRAEVDKCKIQYGSILNWEKIEDKKIGGNIFMFRYALMYDQSPVIWTFIYYRKPSSSTSTSGSPSTSSSLWTLIGLRFNTDILSFAESYQKL